MNLLAAKLKRSKSSIWKPEAGERQLNVLEFIWIARSERQGLDANVRNRRVNLVISRHRRHGLWQARLAPGIRQWLGYGWREADSCTVFTRAEGGL
jgi:hypothetical protein